MNGKRGRALRARIYRRGHPPARVPKDAEGPGVAKTQRLGYHANVPTVHTEDGFQVRIYLPPREHEPPYVHVVKGDGEVIINLGDGDGSPVVREVHGMRDRDALRAYRIVERIRAELIARWRGYHG